MREEYEDEEECKDEECENARGSMMVPYLGSTDCHVQFRTDVHTEDLEEKEEEGGEEGEEEEEKEKGDGSEGGSMSYMRPEVEGVWLTILRTSLSCPYKVCRGCSNNSCRGGHTISCEQGLTPTLPGATHTAAKLPDDTGGVTGTSDEMIARTDLVQGHTCHYV